MGLILYVDMLALKALFTPPFASTRVLSAPPSHPYPRWRTGFGRSRVPYPSDPDFPAAFARCVVKPRRPGRPIPPHTPTDHPFSPPFIPNSPFLSQAGAKHQPTPFLL
ncbi:hypothetical protein GGX14DRAFT_560129 [Mycena pura]|uniref:Uncharacterized protein n=1 Tax=Mycena pura TaxID=153505 RepID=A0AAD6VR11_9AGAR|nr:hypothetical protein GGX14DRAFT_560129 [Mycena pura]